MICGQHVLGCSLLRNLQEVLPFCVGRSRVSLMALGSLCLVHAVLWISVQTENVIEYILVLC